MTLGALLGSYIGLTLSEEGLKTGNYLNFIVFLIGSTFFVVSINAAGNRFHAGFPGMAAVYGVMAIAAGFLAMENAGWLGVNPVIPFITFAVWAFVVGFEALTEIPAYLIKRKL